MSKYVVQKWDGERSGELRVLWRAEEQADASGLHCHLRPWGGYKGGEWTRKDWEISGIGVQGHSPELLKVVTEFVVAERSDLKITPFSTLVKVERKCAEARIHCDFLRGAGPERTGKLSSASTEEHRDVGSVQLQFVAGDSRKRSRPRKSWGVPGWARTTNLSVNSRTR
ncbi:hypothetical protein STEG23_000555 [Scotinomys teguina]